MDRYKSKILITGAAGFIGSTLVSHLLKDGQTHDSLRLLIPPWDTLEKLPKNTFEVAVCDVRDKTSVDNAMKNIDVVYHLAAKVVKRGASYEYYKDTNVDGTKNLLIAAKQHNIKKFIYFSSISVFGLPAWSGDLLGCNEQWEKNFSEPYGRTKFESEQLVKASGIPYIIIRPTTVYGPKDTAGIFQLIKATSKNRFVFVGNAKNKMDYVYVSDVVAAARLAQKGNIQNDDFIIGGGAITQSDLVKHICRALKKRVPKIYIPNIIALFGSYILDGLLTPFGINPPIFPERVKVLTSQCYFDMSKAKKILGYCPKYSFREGSRITADWLITHNLI